MSSHVFNAFASKLSAFFRSAGKLWTAPPDICFLLTGGSVLEFELLGLNLLQG